jgi:hypothetical protein
MSTPTLPPQEPTPLATPDITQAQLLGYGATAVAVIGSLGLDVSATARLVGIVVLVGLLVVGHLVSDAIIRNGRSRHLPGTAEPTATPPELDPTPLPRR